MRNKNTRFKPITNQQKMTIQLILGVSMAVIGMVLLWVSLFIPPQGIIDASVLTAFGEVATFAGALIGIDYTYQYKSIKYLTQKDKEEDEDSEDEEIKND